MRPVILISGVLQEEGTVSKYCLNRAYADAVILCGGIPILALSDYTDMALSLIHIYGGGGYDSKRIWKNHQYFI